MDSWQRFKGKSWRELKRNQDKKLHYFLNNYLYPFSSFYREQFRRHKINPKKIRCVEDLKDIPFTTKEDLLPTKEIPEKFRQFLLLPSKELSKRYLPKKTLLKFSFKKLIFNLSERLDWEFRPIFLTSTTGTTKEPVPVLYTSYDLENLKIYGERLIDLFNIDKDTRALNIFPYAPHLAFWQTFFAGLAHRNFILSTGGGKVMGTDGNLRAIEKIKPSFLLGVPCYIYHLLRSAKERGLKFPFISHIVLGASKVPEGFKQKIIEILHWMGAGQNLYIFGTYGFTEARAAWAECPTDISISSGYHLYPDKEIFEVIDPETGEVKKEGQDGELVYTNIDARGTCVLRYRTGDLVKGGIIYSPCPYCKRGVPRISVDISRASNIKTLNLSKIKGSLVNLNILAFILDDAPGIQEWQIEIRKKDNDPFEVDELVLLLGIKSGVDVNFLKDDLSKKILVQTEISPNEIIVLPLEEMVRRIEVETANKEKRIVDRRSNEAITYGARSAT